MQFYYVYRLVSIKATNRHYTGLTEDLSARLAKHNRGEVPHISFQLQPWVEPV
ncbi:GIY-YIG nuclease family protein [Thalassobacterium maritimum]|uniref:GIY-YIG nuclease family protein n=1 Tax=Thalassobacterium maritimum TaxID=3041265 RepID=UPI0031F2D637